MCVWRSRRRCAYWSHRRRRGRKAERKEHENQTSEAWKVRGDVVAMEEEMVMAVPEHSCEKNQGLRVDLGECVGYIRFTRSRRASRPLAYGQVTAKRVTV